MTTGTKGIFCLEGEWDGRLTDRASVEPQLRMLEDLKACSRVIHRDVATRDEFAYYTSKWLQKQYASYSIAYFAFHGYRNEITLGRESLTLEDMAEVINGKAKGRIIYFGSCETLAVSDDALAGFCRSTGAKAIVGYTARIDWLEAAAFDFILLPQLLTSRYVRPIMTRLTKEHERFVHGLGLRMATSDWVSDRAIAQNAIT